MRPVTLTVVVASLAAALSLASCKTSSVQRSNPPAPATNPGGKDGSAALANYEDDVAPLFKKKCVSCHAAGKTKPDLSTFAAAKKGAKAALAAMKDGSMPQGGKKPSTAEIKVLEDWIKAKYPEGAPVDEDDDDADDDDDDTDDEPKADVVSYDGWVKEFLANNCNSCHGANGTKPQLDSYALAKAGAEASFDAMKNGTMPKNLPDVDATKLGKFESWIELDMPQKDADVDAQPTVTKVTYDGQVKSWVAQYCLGCHNTGGTKPLLASKTDVVAQADAILDAVKTTMPKGNAPMAKADYKVIQDWIAGGKK
jgi:mono/diheme cytochrome c family protein